MHYPSPSRPPDPGVYRAASFYLFSQLAQNGSARLQLTWPFKYRLLKWKQRWNWAVTKPNQARGAPPTVELVEPVEPCGTTAALYFAGSCFVCVVIPYWNRQLQP